MGFEKVTFNFARHVGERIFTIWSPTIKITHHICEWLFATQNIIHVVPTVNKIKV